MDLGGHFLQYEVYEIRVTGSSEDYNFTLQNTTSVFTDESIGKSRSCLIGCCLTTGA